jgi:hypothetical protein
MKLGWVILGIIVALLSGRATALERRPFSLCEDAKPWTDCMTTASGARTVASHDAQGDRILQIFAGKNRQGALFQFVETPAHARRLEMYSLFDGVPPVIVSLTGGQWREVEAAWADWPVRRDAAKVRELADRGGQEIVCLHPSWGSIASNFSRPTELVEFNACDQPWDLVLFDPLDKFVFARMPWCRQLDSEWYYWDYPKFAACLRLYGDKALAVRAVNASFRMEPRTSDNTPRPKTDFLSALASDARLTFEGGNAIRGRNAVAAAWIAAQAGFGNDAWPEFDIATAHNGLVEMTGRITSEAGDAYYTASYRQLWRLGRGGKLELVEWTIGKFIRQKDGV